MSTTVKTSSKKSLRDIIRDTLRIVLPLMISGGLVWWMLSKIRLSEVVATVRHGCDWWWLALMMVVLTLSHIIRGIRWGIQLRAAGIRRLPVLTESVSIFGAYSLNLIVPYLGEAWRCVYISRIGPAKIATVVGTDLGDRISDLVVVITLVIVALFVAHPAMMRFMDHYSVGRDIAAIVSDPMVWICFAAVIGIVAGILWFGRHRSWGESVMRGLRRIWDGFKVLFHMKGIGAYLWLTLGIWGCYFMETYLCFFAFPFTRTLIDTPGLGWGLIPGLVVFVFGSCSIAIPSNGGLGPWNLAVMFALSLYGVSDTDGAAYSMTVWSCETLMLILLGIFSAVYVAVRRKKMRAGAHILKSDK